MLCPSGCSQSGPSAIHLSMYMYVSVVSCRSNHTCFTARRYASAVYAVVVFLSVRSSQAGMVSKMTRRMELVFGMGTSFDLS